MAASSSRKEEERNEKIIRGLLKLPPNRRCINCSSLGPQYVCTSFWTFVCISCSGIHREFTHRVKSVSMSKFTTQEVEALQKGGNQRARESFLKDFDPQQVRQPDSSNIDNLRDFIKAVYVEKKYAGGRFSERPPRDTQNHKTHEEHRRASSYHSFSQSPPYDHQYEERRMGKQTAVLSRKPGSDRGHKGKISNFAYSPGSLHERMSEDGFANESCGSRISDCSGSSMGDLFRTASQSPNFQDSGYSSPPAQQAELNIQISNGITHTQGTGSSGSTDSMSLTSANSGSLADMFFEHDNGYEIPKNNNSEPASFVFSDAASAESQDLFNLPVLPQQAATRSGRTVDLFADIGSQSVARPSAAAPLSENVGWATFDSPPEEPRSGLNGLSGLAATNKDIQHLSHDLFSSIPNNTTTWFQACETNALFTEQFVQASHVVRGTVDASKSQSWSTFDDHTVNIPPILPGTSSAINSDPRGPKGSLDESTNQLWHSFDDISGIVPHNLPNALPQTSQQQNAVNVPLTISNPFTGCEVPEESCGDGSQKLFTKELAHSVPFTAFVKPSPLSAVPPRGGTSADQKSINPFDFPFDSDTEALNMFVDMSALQEALPTSELPTALLDGLPETWFSHNDAAFAPSIPHGLPCLAEQVPSSPLRNIQASAVPSGNPFA